MGKTSAWIAWSYLGYCLALMFFTLGCPMYAVFILDRSPWWLLLMIISGLGYSPWRWFALIDGIERPMSSIKSRS